MNHVYNKIIKRATDESVACKVRCTSCSTTGEVTINDTKVVLNTDGTKTTFDWSVAAYDTLGEFTDAVNAVADWEAVIIDGLRSDSTKADSLDLVGPAGTLTGDETMGATGSDGVSFGWVSSAAFKFPVSIQQEDLPSKTSTNGLSDVTDSGIENVAYRISGELTDTNCTSTLTVYKCVGTTETAIYTDTGPALVTNSMFDFFSGDDVPLSAGDPEVGGRLVAVMSTDTTMGEAFIQIHGQSINRARQAIDGN